MAFVLLYSNLPLSFVFALFRVHLKEYFFFHLFSVAEPEAAGATQAVIHFNSIPSHGS